MKIRNYLTIFVSIILIVALVYLGAFVSWYVDGDASPVPSEVAYYLYFDEVERVLQLDTVTQTPVAETEAVPAATNNVPAAVSTVAETEAVAALPEHSYIFVGDSRTLGMKDAVADKCIYLGKEGEGYNWFSGDGMLALSDYFGMNPKATVIFNLGVNDPENVNVYVDSYKQLIDSHPDATFYVLSVNPLDEKAELNTTNEMIDLFNATMKDAFPGKYLDCNTYLKNSGFETVDGLHYTDATYRAIHKFVVDSLA